MRLLALIAFATFTVTSIAAAATYTATATLTGSTGFGLSLPTNASLSTTLDGSDQIVTYAPLLGVSDGRGSGAGWNLSVASTAFDDGAGHTLAPGEVASVAQSCHAGNACTIAVTQGITYPVPIGSTATKFFNAASGTGLGNLDVRPTFNVIVPGDAYSGSYAATLTLAIASGP
ncbi:MAG TPA: WxL domain-containing protein [Gaiellaceae bacterium]|nr:WxL domain-containing protein [Gaiellaceae bacterium]